MCPFTTVLHAFASLLEAWDSKKLGGHFSVLKQLETIERRGVEWGPSVGPSQPTGTTIISISLYSITTFPYSFILFADTQPVGL